MTLYLKKASVVTFMEKFRQNKKKLYYSLKLFLSLESGIKVYITKGKIGKMSFILHIVVYFLQITSTTTLLFFFSIL